MFKKKESAAQSIKKDKNTSSATPFTPTNTAIPLSKWYQNIVTLPLSKFIEVAVSGNLSALTIEGFPTKEELEDAWKNIKIEFSDFIGDAETRMHASLLRDIAVLNITIQQIEMLVDVLKEIYYKPFCDMLNTILYTTFEFDYEKNLDAYFKNLQACLNRSKGIKIDRDLKMMQFEGVVKKKESGDTGYTLEYFHSNLISLSDYAHYPISTDITTYEYCERIKRYNQHALEQQKHQNGR
jgi:hypothetical protein